jgi:probable F420-dependent oxidoreductase
MKFGVNILNFGPGASHERVLAWAQFAEELGFHFAMTSDHVAITPDVQPLFPAPFYDPFLSLAWISAATHRIKLGTTVTILPYRHPLLTARLAANIDQMCGGRFILGVGVGWAQQEFAALNVPFARRGEIANEYLEVIRMCWTQEQVTYKGKFVSFEGVQTAPPPLQSPGPPIWVGGSSEGAMRRAVRYGDSWHPYRVRVDWLAHAGLPRLREIAATEERPVPALCPRITLHLTESRLPEDQRTAGQGTIAQIRGDLEALAEMGATNVLLDTYTGNPEQTLHPQKDWAALTLLAEQVLDLEQQSLR